MARDPLELSIDRRRIGAEEVAIIRASGEIDLENSAHLAEAMSSETVDGGAGVVLDLRRVPFMDSSGLQAVLVTMRDRGPKLALVVEADSEVARLLDVAELRDRVPNFATEDEAVAAVASDGDDGTA
jgi:stage II sporulation protein AA (anti-sigma F factor antagonist)